MKATLKIEIWDSTTENELNKRGLYRHDMAAMYSRAFSQLVQTVLVPGFKATIGCVVTDNTKDGDGDG